MRDSFIHENYIKIADKTLRSVVTTDKMIKMQKVSHDAHPEF